MGFEEWARSRLAGLLRFAMVLCCDRGVAEDTVQEVLIKAHRGWDRIRQADSPDAYVHRMIVNEYLTWRRKWSRHVPSAEIEPQRAEPDPAESHADRAELVGELAKLPPRQRAVIALRYFVGLSDTEIAEILSCRPATVRSQASRALAKLRVELSEDSTEQSEQPEQPEPRTGATHAH